MKVKKKTIVIPICIVLVICLVAGSVLTIMKMNASKKVIPVYKADILSTYDYVNSSSSYGNVTSDVSQTVYLESDATVQEIFVQEGDSVEVGTPIMQYDTTLMQLDIESKEMDIKKLDININQTTKDIQSLKKGVVPTGGGTLPITDPGSGTGDGTSPMADMGKVPRTMTAAGMDAATTPPTDATDPASSADPASTEPPKTENPAAPVNSTEPHTEPTTEPTTGNTDATDHTDTSEASDQTDASESQSDTESETSSPDTDEPQSETQAPEAFTEPLLDKEFDFSKYDDPSKPDADIVIPISPETKITPEFINLLRGKNPDGSDVTQAPDPNDPEQAKKPDGKIRKAKLKLPDGKTLNFDGNQLNEPFINAKNECTIQEFMDNGNMLLTDELPSLDQKFFELYPSALSNGRMIMVQCTSETMLSPTFIYLMMGRNADGSENANGRPLTAALYLKDLKQTLELDGSKLVLPYVTSIDTPIAAFIENENELSQEPVKELGKDTVLDPSKDHREVYEIYCDDSTIITKDFINRIREEKITVVLKIEGHASWITLDGSKLEEPSEKAIDTPLNEFIANGIALNEESDEPGGDGGIDIGDGNGGGHTADDIKKMLSDKQLELSRLQTQRKQAVLDLEKLQKKLQSATVTSTITGIITTAKPLDENTSTSEPFIVINSTEGLYLKGTLSELKLDTLTVGQKITGFSWNNGISFEATIREISPYPASSSDGNYGNNPNSSLYPFIAYIENPEGLRDGEMVDISTDSSYDPMRGISDGENSNLGIAKAFIRDDGDGKPYAYIANSEGRLEKIYVKTGKTIQNSFVEILDNAITPVSYTHLTLPTNSRV